MARAKFAFGLALGSLVLTLMTFFMLPATSLGARPVLTPDQARLAGDKERARAAAGAPALSRPDGVYAGPDVRVRPYTHTVQTSKAELLAAWQEGWTRNQDYLAALERDMGPGAARAARARLEAERQRIEALPDGPVELPVPMIEVGGHSINFSTFTYDSGGGQQDPMNFVFYRVGAAWDVQYDLQYWAYYSWKLTECGGDQKAWINDADHYNGWNGWKWMDYQLEPLDSVQWCGYKRDHLRLFGSFVEDSHWEFGWWTAANVHHDNIGHSCVDDWEGAQTRLEDSFRDQNGYLLWFVGSQWQVNFSNAGDYDCAWNNGWGTYVELIY
ncbi:MAG: hypothetical protein M3Q71_09075 [Chloroflexota bacterium]|nr:hypothetical protein [Chloroflexota bacterium]MDP9470809.1 hypothetical protein [Chloroflexota bacterium]